MTLNQAINKIQFKIDHAPFAYRVAILLGALLILFIPWFIFIYKPQAEVAEHIKTNIQALITQTQTLQTKYNNIIALEKNHNTDKLVAKYLELQEDKRALNFQILHFQHRYINDKDLAHFLYDVLKEINGVQIENFSTIVKEAPQPVAPLPKSGKEAKPPAPAPTQSLSPDLATEKTYYSLSLVGDYFAIVRFLQRIEGMKWQLFWDKLDYKVQHYPIAQVTIEFFTLKPQAAPVPTKEVPK